jgi:hypothetical protein
MTVTYENERPANGLSGVLIFNISGTPIFRVYNEDASGEFMDYYIWHDDLAITIHSDELASLYEINDTHSDEGYSVVDHTSAVLDITVNENTCSICGALLMAEGSDSYCPKCRERNK